MPKVSDSTQSEYSSTIQFGNKTKKNLRPDLISSSQLLNLTVSDQSWFFLMIAGHLKGTSVSSQIPFQEYITQDGFKLQVKLNTLTQPSSHSLKITLPTLLAHSLRTKELFSGTYITNQETQTTTQTPSPSQKKFLTGLDQLIPNNQYHLVHGTSILNNLWISSQLTQIL